jgi:hypothetical protein
MHQEPLPFIGDGRQELEWNVSKNATLRVCFNLNQPKTKLGKPWFEFKQKKIHQSLTVGVNSSGTRCRQKAG